MSTVIGQGQRAIAEMLARSLIPTTVLGERMAVRGFPTVEHRAIRNIKREDRGVSLDEALALCEILGVTMSIQDGMVILSDSPTLAQRNIGEASA